MRINGDKQEDKAELDNFIFPESKYPVIATTPKLMTTGIDAQTCKLIVLDQRIQSMTEFKQIIGRKQVVRLHRKGIKVMQVVAMTGLSYPTVRAALTYTKRAVGRPFAGIARAQQRRWPRAWPSAGRGHSAHDH